MQNHTCLQPVYKYVHKFNLKQKIDKTLGLDTFNKLVNVKLSLIVNLLIGETDVIWAYKNISRSQLVEAKHTQINV